MQTRHLTVAMLCNIMLLSGCSLFPETQKKMFQNYAAPAITYKADRAAPTLLEQIQKTEDNKTKTGLVDSRCLTQLDDTKLETQQQPSCTQQRNLAITILLTESDNVCQTHVTTIFGNEAAFNITSGTITNIASGWGAIASSSAAKSLLASIAFLSNAERSLINESVYKNMLVSAVTKKIGEARKGEKLAISAKLKTPISDYSVLEGINDVISYHQTCSFMYGLQKALDEGIQPSTGTKIAQLEQAKANLEMYIKNKGSTNNTDPGIDGAKDRIAEIEKQLLTLIQVK